MADGEDEGQKTEEPSQRKLEEARRRGQVVTSQEVKHWFVLLGGLIVLLAMAPAAARLMTDRLGGWLGNLDRVPTDGGALIALMGRGVESVTLILLMPLVLLVLMAVGGSLIQHGPMLSFEQLRPKLEKISPGAGVKRLFSARALSEFLKGLVKLAVVAAVGVAVVMPEMAGLDTLAGLSPAGIMERSWSLAGRLTIAVLAVMSLVAGLDYLYQRWEFMKQQRMSKQELKDEYRQTEGDPHVRARIRQIRMERARRRMMAAVPEADVVVTNPTHVAVAMKYDPATMPAPKVLAKGADLIARRIREVAQEAGVAVVENPPLARALFQAVEIGQEIPPEHYKAVAGVISYVFRLQRRAMPAGQAPPSEAVSDSRRAEQTAILPTTK
jgi:flagellar biosynthetic protein FlhB